MLDVKTGTVIANATVVVTGARIVAAGANVAVPRAPRSSTSATSLLMPGLDRQPHASVTEL